MDGGVSTAAKEEYFLVRGLDEDARQLQRTLGMIQAYLSDAENKSITQHAVKIWLGELEAVAFDADNVLDELSYHFLHKKVKKMMAPKAKDKVISSFSSFNRVSRRHNMAHTIKQINTTFEAMNKRASDLGLQSMVVNAPVLAAHTSLETDSFSLDPIFIGRDDDVPKLVDLLTQTRPKERIFSILALVGMGGLGKTTLTRKVFNHERVKARFGSHIWVHVSQTFDPILLLRKILLTLTPDIGDGIQSREVILKKLQEALVAKTFLLVLDDIWNEDIPKWEDFINSISGVTSTKENGIIITTRKEKVASIVIPLEIHHLNGLSDDDCWYIIKAKNFDGNGEVPSGFEMIGRKIAKACQGLPLDANVVGGVLRYKSVEEWHFMSENWLSDEEGGQNIKNILKLSFDDLSPPSLKKCFAYCSVFPKGQEIVKQELIELWMAEGFLQPSRRYDMESVGNMLFNVLLHNSLLQVAQRDKDGNVRKCVMHDLVHDLASSVLSNNAHVITPVRYMFLEERSSTIPKEVATHLRTFFSRGVRYGNMFPDFKCLRNLTLYGGDYTELPKSLRKLIHLRNLDISCTIIRNLPEWINTLHHLQTLRADSWVLKKLPSTLKYLINLRHLYIAIDSEIEFPAEIGRLTSLQTLPYFKVGKEKGYQIEELGSLKSLKGELYIGNLERVRDKEEALKANIFENPNLFHLKFSWSAEKENERNDESVLEGLQPHANLRTLAIFGFQGKRLGSWCEKMAVRDGPRGSWVPLHNLIGISLSSCSEIEEIPMVEHLPNLKSLCLLGLKKVRFVNSSLNLRSLRIKRLERLECLPDCLFYNNPNLSYLEISECRLLRALPDGLDTLNSLDQLTIEDCKNLKSIGNPMGGTGQHRGVLHRLSIIRCRELVELPPQMLDLWAPTIEFLQLEELRSLKNLPMLIDCLSKSSTRLNELRIVGVPNLMAAGSVESSGLGSLSKLVIDVSVNWSREDCDAIEHTVDALLEGCRDSLSRLKLRGVENCEWLPQSIQHLTALDSLKLENVGVQEFPLWFGDLSCLSKLSIHGCKKVRSLPSVNALKSLTQLKRLEIKDCRELHIDSEWHNHRHLKIKVVESM
ncbi:putative disease resistance protein RGA3 [Salvia hispanica]|uniref:putative disease resistance protein RGA3 n=1 Tax=Salvia hispanica TaxID=49212 RepID=UPI002009429B|nr:putative disease resistance protein RGA3 [Salvia hispanica]